MPKSTSNDLPTEGEEANQLELFDLPSTGDAAADRAGVSLPEAQASVPDAVMEIDLPQLELEMTARARAFAMEFQLGALSDRVQVAWNSRMRTAAGRAHYQECRIELNPRLASLDDPGEEIERTFLHELAHLVAHYRNRGRKIQPHGGEWRRACADLGIPGESVYHQLPFETRKIRRQYAYRCPVCGTEFERVRRFRRVVACYACCREHCGGHYNERFRLVMRRL